MKSEVLLMNFCFNYSLQRRQHPLVRPRLRLSTKALPPSHYTSQSYFPFYMSLLTLLLYSYDAAEDNEITFREGDIIKEIEPASEDWWQGKDTHGRTGLFPGKLSRIFIDVRYGVDFSLKRIM
jgi:SH3 domain